MKIMKESDTLKIYGKTINRWTAFDEKSGKEITTQREIEYQEYDRNGNLVGCGTEDFSTERWKAEIRSYMMWAWDGKTRNKAGQKWFRCLFYRTIRKSDIWKLKQVTAAWYKDHGFAQIDARVI